ncbi:lectin subunit alpha-like [Haematobia irritans]
MSRINLKIVIGFVFSLISITEAVPQWRNTTDGQQFLIDGDQKYNWFQAFHECARRNMQLVEVHSQVKNQALIAILKPLYGNSHNFWLGANDEYNKNKEFKRPFYWSSSGKPMTFAYWSHNNPDNDRHDEHCVHTWSSRSEYQWNDNHCDTARLGFICEDHHLHADVMKSMEAKQKIAKATNMKLHEEFNRQQKLLTEKFEIQLKEIRTIETELKELLHNIHTKLEFDISHALAEHKREVNSVVEDKMRNIRNIHAELAGMSEVMTKSFSNEMESA